MRGGILRVNDQQPRTAREASPPSGGSTVALRIIRALACGHPGANPFLNPPAKLVLLASDLVEIHLGRRDAAVPELLLDLKQTVGLLTQHPCKGMARLVQMDVRDAGRCGVVLQTLHKAVRGQRPLWLAPFLFEWRAAVR